MKKLYLFITAAWLALAATAAPLTPQQALARLNSDNSAQTAKAKGTMQSASPARTFTTTTGQPAIYAFTCSDSKCLFVAADDVASPLIGYTDSSTTDLDSLPPAMKEWLDNSVSEIEKVSANPAKYKTTAVTSSTSHKAVAPLLKTKWDQSTPYNDLCPKYGGGTSYTGCGATAMAQIMNHFQWPAEHGQGSITYHPKNWTDNNTQLSMDFSKTTFDWASMKDEYTTGNYTEAEGNAVATLMKACGYAIKMQYSASGSEASIADIGTALAENFDYSQNYKYVIRNYCSTEEWYRLHYSSLEAGSPICYRAGSPSGGHLFVCDGSDDNGYFHFNWGWSGSYDGYFLLNPLNPDYVAGGLENGYTDWQMAIFNIHPKVEGEAYEQRQMTSSGSFKMELTEGKIIMKADNGSLIYNNNLTPMHINVAIECQPVDEQGKKTGEAVYFNLADETTIAHDTGFTKVQLPADELSSLAAGTYKVQLVTKDLDAESPSWSELMHNDYTPNYSYIVKNTDGTMEFLHVAAYNNVNFKKFKVVSPLCYGCPVKLYTEVENTSDKAVTITFLPYIMSTTMPDNGEVNYQSEAEMPILLTLQPGETKQYEWITRFNSGKEISGQCTATLGLTDPATGIQIEGITTETTYYLKGKPTVTDFKINGCNMTGGKYIVSDPSKIQFTATVSCKEGAYSEQVYITIWSSNLNTIYHYSAAPIVFAEQGTPHMLNTAEDCSGIAENVTYKALLANLSENNFIPLYTENDEIPSDIILEFMIDKSTGVGAIMADGKPFSIYNAQGMSIKENASAAELDALPSGMYIIRQGEKAATIRR